MTIKIKSMKLTEGEFSTFDIEAPKGTDRAAAQLAINKVGEVFHDDLEAMLINVNECFLQILEEQKGA